MAVRNHMRSARRAAAVGGLLLLFAAGMPAAASASITARGPADVTTYASDSTKSLRASAPAGAQAGDVLTATIGFGSSGAKSQPTLTAPAGWTLASRTNQGKVGALAVYHHVYAAGESAYTWTTSTSVGGVVSVAAFGGVDTANPIDASAGRSITQRSSSIATPSVTTSSPGDMLVAGYFGYRGAGGGTAWTPPSGMAELADASNSSGSRSGSVAAAEQPSAGATGAKTATTSAAQDYAVATLTALRPKSGATSSAPTISAVRAGAITTAGATITWTTDQASDSEVEYGPTTSYGATTQRDTTLVTSHSSNLAGLAANTVYHYRVKSRNAAGDLAVSPDFTFQTGTRWRGAADHRHRHLQRRRRRRGPGHRLRAPAQGRGARGGDRRQHAHEQARRGHQLVEVRVRHHELLQLPRDTDRDRDAQQRHRGQLARLHRPLRQAGPCAPPHRSRPSACSAARSPRSPTAAS